MFTTIVSHHQTFLCAQPKANLEPEESVLDDAFSANTDELISNLSILLVQLHNEIGLDEFFQCQLKFVAATINCRTTRWDVLIEFEFHSSVGAAMSGKSSFAVAAANATTARS